MKAALEEAVTGSRQEDIAAARAATQALEARLQEVESMARDVELRSPVGRSARSLWTWGNWWRRAILW